MTYLEGVNLIHEIEKKYDVMSIQYKGVRVWSYLRLYLLDKITANRENKVSSSNVRLVLRCLFAYNPFKVFRRYNVWIFTACERRKQLGNKMVQRVSGGASTINEKMLMIEKPLSGVGHYPKAEVEEKNILSESWLLMFFHLFEIISRPFTPKVHNEDILRQILKDNEISFNYRHYIRLLNAQCKAMSLMLSIVPKPKIALMECPYDSMGYMWAFKRKGVKIIELQHGVLNKNHNAYNAIDYECQMNPDCICVFGEQEFKYFTEDKPQYAPKVLMTGLYMLERSDEFFNADIFNSYRKKYEKIIVVAGEDNFETALGGFVDEVAKRRKDLLFLYIPRRNEVALQFMSDNVKLVKGVNIYEYLKWADVHVTRSSTTCLEGHYYHTPTIFVNFDNVAVEYYGDILKEENGAIYIERPDQFDNALKILSKQETKWKELFAHNHLKKINEIVSEYESNN